MLYLSKNSYYNRHLNRKLVIQFLYMLYINSFFKNQKNYDKNNKIKYMINIFFKYYVCQSSKTFIFFTELIYGIIKNINNILYTISNYANNWLLNRILKIDLSILTLSIYEIIYRIDIPNIVSINEAINLSKEFSGKKSKKFINGILDKINIDNK